MTGLVLTALAAPIYLLLAVHVAHRTLGAWRRKRCGCARCLMFEPHLGPMPRRQG